FFGGDDGITDGRRAKHHFPARQQVTEDRILARAGRPRDARILRAAIVVEIAATIAQLIVTNIFGDDPADEIAVLLATEGAASADQLIVGIRHPPREEGAV